ncbi:outer membrane protein assembly factor BamB [Porticoccus sp. W117]|uniref:outer membrane protein assembly factor BamB n=1 Tax=Porticoccus sp. W117 TaxID=3054777 RepID=UPI002592556C|nr:outer membrane protein assembly factor BamB [Porticoccus sp. W117]MDM3870132.1 outer membrane protein assembly factor BamB [Porticoccus sp. W117]
MQVTPPLKYLAAAAMFLLLAACSSKDDKEQPAELVKFPQEVTIKRLWSQGVGGAHNKYLTGMRPVLRNGVIYAASGKGRVSAFNSETGKRLWKAKVVKGLSGGVGFGGSQVYVGDIEGRLYALSASDGIQQWQVSLRSEVLSAASGDRERVAVQTKDGLIYMLSAESGEELWQYKTQTPPLTNYGTSSPLLIGDLVIVGTADGQVVALNAETGSRLWENRISNPRGRTELEKLSDVDGEIAVDGQVLYATSYQGTTVALSRSRGSQLGSQKSSSYHGPAVSGSRVFVVEEGDYVRALRGTAMQPLWENDQLKLRGLNAPAVVAGYVAVADAEGYLHLLDSGDGHFVGRKKVDGSGVRVPMIGDGDRLYIQDHGGGLSCYQVTPK